MRWPLFLGLRLLKAVGYFKHQTPKHPHQQPSVALGVSWPKAASQAWCVASRCRRHDPLATAPATKRWDWINQNCFQDAEKTWIKNTHTKQSKNRQPKDEGRIVINFHIYHSNETFETNHVSCDSWKLGSLGIPGRPVLELLGHIRTSDQFVDDGSVGSVRFRLLFFFPRIHWQSPVMRSNSMSQLGSSNEISCCPAGQVVGSNPHGCPVGGTHRMALSMANNFRQTRVV